MPHAICGLGSIKMLNMIKNPEKGKHNDRNTQQIQNCVND
jgi:hypothetical protein